MSKYKEIKDLFLDSLDSENYVELEYMAYNYQLLEESLEKPLKMILLFGRPGTGKSMTLTRLYEDLKDKRDIHYFEAPILSEKEFLKSIYEAMSSQIIPQNMRVNFDGLLKYCQKQRGQRDVVFLLDECQLYSEALMEKIRLLSDTRVVKFVITLHKTDNEEIIAKEHFKTRIWEVIELKNATENDLGVYIQKKLLQKSFVEVSNSISKRDIRFIHQHTKGNFRDTNKFLYIVFNIYEYYEKNQPQKINAAKFSKKILEMAALKLGYLHD